MTARCPQEDSDAPIPGPAECRPAARISQARHHRNILKIPDSYPIPLRFLYCPFAQTKILIDRFMASLDDFHSQMPMMTDDPSLDE